MAASPNYYISIRPNDVVGPHTLDTLREWVYLNFLSPDTPGCPVGGNEWISIGQIPCFFEYSENLKDRLDAIKTQEPKRWWTDDVTEKQLAKLTYFNIPFKRRGLTKGSASQLIDYFVSIDPARETEYKDRPATTDQKRRLREIGTSERGLTYDAAKTLIQDLEIERNEEMVDFDILANDANDEDKRDFYGYLKLSTRELEKFLAYLRKERPDWQDEGSYDYLELVPRLFPHLRSRRASGKSKAAGNSKSGGGCAWFLFAVLVGIVISTSKCDSPRSPAKPNAAKERKSETPQNAAPSNIPQATSEPTILVDDRVWTSSDGRKMTAALLSVDPSAAGVFEGHFLRDDGKLFDLQISKLSPEDIDLVKSAMIEAGLWNRDSRK